MWSGSHLFPARVDLILSLFDSMLTGFEDHTVYSFFLPGGGGWVPLKWQAAPIMISARASNCELGGPSIFSASSNTRQPHTTPTSCHQGYHFRTSQDVAEHRLSDQALRQGQQHLSALFSPACPYKHRPRHSHTPDTPLSSRTSATTKELITSAFAKVVVHRQATERRRVVVTRVRVSTER